MGNVFKRWSVGCVVALWLFLPGLIEAAGQQWPEATLTSQDRILILAPHPDDEVLGCGGILQQAIAKGVPVRVVLLTYGDSNQWSFLVYRKHPVVVPGSIQRMGLIRREEAITSARTLGLSADHLVFLGYPDSGTLAIWDSHWGTRPPFRSLLTRAKAVPYKNALRPGAPYKGEDVLQDLKTALRDFKPTKVFVSHPADHNPDHRALYLFTRVALWDLEKEMTPELYPYLIHFKRWPRVKAEQTTAPLAPPSSLSQQIQWRVHSLSPEEMQRKKSALRAHRTQYGYSRKYLLLFVRPNELFGDFPPVLLRLNPSLEALSSKEKEETEGTPEELTDQEQAAFVGFEERSVQLQENQLVLSIKFSRPLAEAVSASIYFFNYRNDRSFAQMPKLHVKFGAFGHEVYDQDQKLSQDAVQVNRQPGEITIRVPLEVLGNPQKILTSARTYLGDVPLDWVSWRVLDLSAGD